MANNLWINTLGGDSNVAGSWSLGHVPDNTEDVIIDAASFAADGKVINIAANFECKSFDCSAADQLFTISSAVYTFSVYGAFTGSNKLTMTLTGTSFFYCKGTGTFTQGSATLNLNQWHVNQAGITVTSGDNFSIGATAIYLTNGTWDQAGKTITSTGSFITATGTKTLTSGAGTFNIGIWNNAAPTNFTFTSTNGTVNITTTSTITGATTFYNLTLTGVSAITAQISLAANITVSNVFTPTGINAQEKRILIASNTIGTPRTITAASVTETNCDYRDITMAGACLVGGTLPLPVDGLRGDCGGNSAITFTTGINLYYKHTSGACTWKDTTKWFTDLSPRTTAASRVPLPQDTNAI
jgi:hypothetical protein